MTDEIVPKQENDPLRPAVVLCVEDEADLRTDIAEELAGAGYRVLEASHGLEALAAITTVRPDLILCDVTMPVMGGYELMETIRRDRPDMAQVPFIFLTALADRAEIIQGKSAGADDYLVKPVDFDDLLLTIRARLGLTGRVRQSLVAELERERRQVIERAVREGDVTLGALAGALDRLSTGVFLLEEGGVLKFANQTGRQLLERGDGLMVTSSGLRATSARSSQMLKSALSKVMGKTGSSETLALSREDAHPLLAQLSSLELPGVNLGHAVMFVVDPEAKAEPSQGLLAAMFGCTPAEARLAAALVAGKKLDEIGKEFGVAHTTITFHLQNLFQKTHTNRQADLIALLIRATVSLDLTA